MTFYPFIQVIYLSANLSANLGANLGATLGATLNILNNVRFASGCSSLQTSMIFGDVMVNWALSEKKMTEASFH